jgi:choline dehydrogenase-like flavoprotein
VRLAGNTMVRVARWNTVEFDRHAILDDPNTAWLSTLRLGGLSNNWTGAVPRFAPQDFTDGSRIDERFDWPIRYDDLVPYYESIERLIGVTCGDDFANIPANVRRHTYRPPADWRSLATAARARGYHLGPIPLAKGRPTSVLLRGTEFNSFHTIVKPLQSSARFQLIGGAHVTGLHWNSSAGRVDSVQYVDRATGQAVTLPCRAVVVAAGALVSARLLMQSTSADFPTGLGNTSGVLGSYLHDHPRVWFPLELSRPFRAPSHLMYLSRDDYRDDRPLSGASASIGLESPRDRLRTYVGGRVSQLGVQIFGTMIPSEDCFLRLTDQPLDHLPERKLGISMRYDAHARRTLDDAVVRVVELFATAGVVASVVEPLHELMPGTSVHYGGAVRMHRSPQFGVLDGWNRMHDVPNVAVTDASSFTTGPEKNPTLTAMAISARAADGLAADLRSGVI